MAELVKFHEKNKVLYAKIEAVAGTYNAPSATDALPVITLDGNITTDTGSYQYLGDSLSRDEFSYVKDQYADFSCETPQQVLGSLNAALTVGAVPMSAWYQACGGYITVFGSAIGGFAAGTVFIDNASVSDSTLSIDYRQASAQDTVNQKLRKFINCKGTMDVSASLGDLPKLKFAMKGNATTPIQAVAMSPQFGNQFTNVVASVQQATILNAQIARRDGTYSAFGGSISTITKANKMAILTTAAAHGLGNVGDIRFINVSGASESVYNGVTLATIISATQLMYVMSAVPAANASGTLTMTVADAAKNFCFSTLSAPNFFGYDYQRYITGCEVGFSKAATPTDISVTLLENIAPATEITAVSSLGTTATVTAAGHGLSAGNTVVISNTIAAYNGTFVVSATGLTSDQFQVTIPSYTGTFSGKGIVVNSSFDKFDPDSHISDFYGVQVKFGEATGGYVTYKWDKVQVKDVKEDKVSSYLGRGVSFRNTGKSFIILE